MKSRTRLDSAVFQLTPTRTRYTLVINSNGKTEKISSGLLNPFVAHLKAVQDQFARGCYSIMLEPNPVGDAIWFTKGTVQRFVRFVNSPDVLERVSLTESEILQIKEAIAIQNSDVSEHKKVQNLGVKSLESNEGSLPIVNVHAEGTIVIYKLGAHSINSNGVERRENSKIQLLRVLETRKTVLQKEQSMAFARAIAAGFDMDRIVHLISFSECFGAPRLMEACLGFMVQWRKSQGQWFKLEAKEAMASQSECNEFKEASDYNHTGMEENGKASNAVTAVPTVDHNKGKKSSSQFYQPLQGMPCNNPLGGNPFLQSPYPQIQGPRYSNTISIATKKHLMDRKNENTKSETLETNVSCMRPHGGSELKKQLSQGQEQWRKVGRNCKKKSGVVDIRNITYISSEGRHVSTLACESDKEDEDVWGCQKCNKQSVCSGKRKESYTRPTASDNSYYNIESTSNVVDTGNWQVFQNILLQHNNEDRHADHGTSAQEEEILFNGQQNRTGNDPIVPHQQESYEVRSGRENEYCTNLAKKTRLLSASSNDLMSSPRESGRGSNDCLANLHFTETQSGSGGYEKPLIDEFAIYGQKTRPDYQNFSSDPLVESGLADTNKNLCNNSFSNVIDESFRLSQRSGLPHKSKTDSTILVNENELDSVRRQLSYEPDDLTLLPNCGIVKESVGYDPAVDYETQIFGGSNVTGQNRIKEDHACGVEEISLKLDKDIKARSLHDNAMTEKNGKASKLIRFAEVQDRAKRMGSSKIDLQKMKKTKEEEEIKRLDALKREREKRIAGRSNSGPAQLTSASQTRPQLIPKVSSTSYKGSNFGNPEPCPISPHQNLPNRTASLGSNVPQKITANNSLNKISPSQSTPSPHTRPQPQSKLSPVSYKGSKFSDSEPGPSSPLQRLRSRAASLKSNASQKITGVGLNGNNQNASWKSICSSPPEPNKGNAPVTPERKVSASHIRELPDPKKRNMDHVSSANLDTPTSPESKVDAIGAVQLPKPKTSSRHHISPTKVRTPYSLTKPKEADGESISKSQVSQGRSQVAVYPNLKSKLSKHPSDIVPNKAIELSLKRNCGSSVTLEAMQVQESNEEPLHNRNGEDKQVIETTVVLGNETSLIPLIQVDGERIDTRKESNTHEDGENTGVTKKDAPIPAAASPVDITKEKHEDDENAGITRDAAIRATTSPVATREVGDSAACHFEKNLYSHKVTTDYDIKELPKCSSTDFSTTPYQTTFVTVSSLESPCITNLEFTNVPPSASEISEIPVETAVVPASDFTDSNRFEKTPGSLCKPQVKVISKGISSMFRFGKTIRKPNVISKRLINKGAMVHNCLASTASSNKVKISEQSRFRESMSYALYIA